MATDLRDTALNPNMPMRRDQLAQMTATPRSPRLGFLADAMMALKEFGNRVQVPAGVPLLGGEGVGSLLLGKAPEELVEMSYGNMPMRINPYAGQTASFVPEMKPGRGAQVADLLSLAPTPGGARAAAGLAGMADMGGAERAAIGGAARYIDGGQKYDIDRAWRDLSGFNKFSDFDNPSVTKTTDQNGDFVLYRQNGDKWVSLSAKEIPEGGAYSSSLEAVDYPKGTGAATTMYLEALNIAKQRGMGWTSEGIRSDESRAIYNRLKKAGVPFVEKDGSSTLSAKQLSKIDLQSVANKLASEAKAK